jgi:hypothetical protein
MAKLTGTNPDQVPTNADLGTMAYQDKDQIKVGTIESTTESGAVLFKTGDDQYSSVLVGKRPIGDNFANVEFDAGQSNGVMKIEGDGNGHLSFYTANGSRTTILSNGNVGIGTASPSKKLHVRKESTNTYDTVALLQHYDTDDSTLRSEVSIGSGENTYFKTFVTSGSTDFLIVDQDNTDGRLSFQVKGNAGSTDSFAVDSTGRVEVRSGKLRLDGNDIGGTQVTIADDAVASITPPRKGGFMFISCRGETIYPQSIDSGVFYYDVGASLQLNRTAFAGVGSNMDVVTTDLTGTTGTDGRTTISAQSGVIKIENRLNTPSNFQVTFL